MTIFDKNAIKELFLQKGMIVGDIDLDEDGYIATVYIEVNSIGLYSPMEINIIAGKIKNLETELVMKGFIHDIKIGDFYKGNWRILIHFLNEDEIAEWEENVLKKED
jgi:hypothetical protein